MKIVIVTLMDTWMKHEMHWRGCESDDNGGNVDGGHKSMDNGGDGDGNSGKSDGSRATVMVYI